MEIVKKKTMELAWDLMMTALTTSLANAHRMLLMAMDLGLPVESPLPQALRHCCIFIS